MGDPLPQDIAGALQRTADRRGAVGASVLYFVEIGSTNDVAAALADDGAAEGTVVVASAQTAGRGRLGRTWFSPPGAGLYTSVVIRDRRVAPLITLAGGVAIATGVRNATGLSVEIKWPNDVVVHTGLGRRRKLAGILAEATSDASGLQYVILGFGINIKAASYPAEIADRATSLETELGRVVDVGTVLGECLAEMAQRLAQLRNDDSERVLGDWRTLSPSATGAVVDWDGPHGKMTGRTAGIDASGALLVQRAGQIERIIAGTVSWR